jgi:hypothetical protein
MALLSHDEHAAAEAMIDMWSAHRGTVRVWSHHREDLPQLHQDLEQVMLRIKDTIPPEAFWEFAMLWEITLETIEDAAEAPRKSETVGLESPQAVPDMGRRIVQSLFGVYFCRMWRGLCRVKSLSRASGDHRCFTLRAIELATMTDSLRQDEAYGEEKFRAFADAFLLSWA